MTSSADVVIHAVGDVFFDRDDPAEVFAAMQGVIDAADVVFGNCEAPLCRTGDVTRDTTLVADAKRAPGLAVAGFNVMSCANNHVTDLGDEGLFSTLDTLHDLGIATAGAGKDLGQARRPAVVTTVGGERVAVLAYACYYPRAATATADRAGVVPVGGETVDPPPMAMCSPGVAPLVTSLPHEDEVHAMASDISAAKATGAIVMASFHWGDATRPAVLTDHEQRTAHAAIDAGADVVVGHHHHVLRGIDVYRGKPIFYGLGNFVWDAPEGWAEMFSPGTAERMLRLGKYAIKPRPGYPRLPFHPDGRMTAIARFRLREGELVWGGFVPCRIEPSGRVVPLDVASPSGVQVVEFLREACDDADLHVDLVPDPGERVGGYTAVEVRPGG